MTNPSLERLVNHQVRLAARPVGLPVDSDWSYTEGPVVPPGPGDVVVRMVMLSLDPAMRGWMNEGKSYVPPVEIGAVMRAIGVGVVAASQHPGYKEGDAVAVGSGVQEFLTVREADQRRVGLTKIDLRAGSWTQWHNVLGMPGMTAWFGLFDVGQPKPGETVVVSGAAGAVGQTVGQLAKLHGCRVVGIAGGAAKCRFVVDELGFDACIDYKAGDVKQGLKEHCPDGVHVYFDNVGGEILEAALARLARGARIVICGAISQYNATEGVAGPRNYLSLLVNRARMQGMVVFDYADRYAEAAAAMAGHLRAGRMKSREDVVEGGVAAFPHALLKLFSGENFGKLVLQVSAPPPR
jgi:NADPH-dependent curcumin reductase CurA